MTLTSGLAIGLVGNPNSGKTTVFNALTGARQRVGNWPGVTVERKSGVFVESKTTVEVVDLPGVYALTDLSGSLDEKIATAFIEAREADVIVNVIDANNLERNLYLTVQLLEKNIPVILAVNMLDVARSRGIHISLSALEQALGCPVIGLEAHKKKGIQALKNLIVKKNIPLPLKRDLKLEAATEEDADILLADARYRFIEELIQKCVATHSSQTRTWTEVLDRIFLNRFLSIPLFLMIMYALFFWAVNIGGALQDFFDIASDTIFVQGFGHLLAAMGMPDGMITLLADGVGKGINTTITFIPVIGALFLGLAFLEDSGYMMRAAFIVDRLMRALGLPGKSFVPMIVGFGCNVPAVMAARTLENQRDRILTIMMSPFMSCGARLAIYAVFTAAFFPVGGQNVVFALYLIGILMAVLTGLLLRKTLLRGEAAPLIMELPPYHVPSFKKLCLHAWQRLKDFVWRAGKWIVPLCILLGILNQAGTLPIVGQAITPIFAPMGIQSDNWPATVGLITGVLAKEVVIGTLNTLYSQAAHLALSTESFSFWGGLSEAFASIPANFSELSGAFANPILAAAPVHTLTQNVYGVMASRFDGQAGAMAYLLFVLLYVPCVSTVAAMVRELNRAWGIFSIFWSTSVAYGAAVIFYQLATAAEHLWSSLLWVAGFAVFFIVIVRGLFWISANNARKKYGFA